MMKIFAKARHMPGMVLRTGLAVLLGLPLAGFTALGIFGTLVPKDWGVEVVSGIAYGPQSRHLLDIYRPRDAAGPLPVVFFGYGGGWDSGEKGDYAFVGKALAARGFVTVIADYRLVPEVVYPVFLEDNALALAWTGREIAAYGGDPRALFLAGHSAGAYNIMMLALDPSYLEEAGAALSILGVAGLSGPYDFYPFDVAQSRNAFGHVPDPRVTQPINHVRADAPPLFLAHGDSDDVVYLRNTLALAEAQIALGSSVEVQVYEGAGHADTLTAISMPLRWRYPVLDDLTGFFRRQLPP